MQDRCSSREGEKAMLFQPVEIDVQEGLQYAETVVMLKPSTKMLLYTRKLKFITYNLSNQLLPCKLKKEESNQLLTP